MRRRHRPGHEGFDAAETRGNDGERCVAHEMLCRLETASHVETQHAAEAVK